MNDWRNVDYLKSGNRTQQSCFTILEETKVLEKLQIFDPIVVGTIPICIDINDSDIDIVCSARNLVYFQLVAGMHFGHYQNFSYDWSKYYFTCNFWYKDMQIELYAESIKSEQHKAYRHMVTEHRILQLAGDKFSEQVVMLKNKGFKTEPAFGKLLNLIAPYDDLLELQNYTDHELSAFITERWCSDPISI